MIAGSRPAVIALLALTAAGAARSQQPAGTIQFRYVPAQLDCATYAERSRARLEAETGARRRRETLLRDGVLRFRARPANEAIALEAWYDSLALSRESPEAKLVPDTDGLLGGRFRGTLSTSGRYQVQARPFVPDEVAEVADVGAALDDLLPPLPTRALAVGQEWSDGHGLELRRIADSTADRRLIQRLVMHARSRSGTASIKGDTTQLSATEVTTEDGEIDWDQERGLLRRGRHIVVETTVPAGGPLKLPLRSRLEQDVELVLGPRGCDGGGSAR